MIISKIVIDCSSIIRYNIMLEKIVLYLFNVTKKEISNE